MAALASENPRPRPVSTGGTAVAHILVSSLFLAVGGILTALALISLRFPSLLSGPLAYGRLRPMAMTATMLGWLVPALLGGVYYVLPRLTGTRLWREDLATLTLWVLEGLTVAGMAVVGLGLGDGVEPLGLPWWLDLPVLLALLVPLVVTVQTVRRRAERSVYVTLWFVMAGVAWLPLLYLFGNLPGISAVGRELGESNFTAGFITLWVLSVGTGLAYYTVVKSTDEPLANRQLARAGFWSFAFAATWAGPLRIMLGPTPDWLDLVAAVLTLALPVAALANAAAISTTIGRAWERIRDRPVEMATAAGLAFAVVVAIASALASFRAAGALVALTPYWDGITFAALFGAGGLLVAGWVYQALPPLTGRRLASVALARRHVRLTVWGVGGTAGLLAMAGVVTGFGWTGAAFAGAFEDPTTPWAIGSGAAGVFLGSAIATVLLAVAGQLTFLLAVYRTVTAGHVTVQEVLVEREVEA